MGLIEESLDIYQQILADIPASNSNNHKIITEKIKELKKELVEQDQIDNENVSAEDISNFRKTLSSNKDIPAIIDGVAAFKDLGLWKEAVLEYEKLFNLGYSPEKIIPEFTECLFKIHSPSKVLEQFDRIIRNNGFDNKDKAQVKFMLGKEMEKRDFKDLALDLYRAAREIEPDNNKITNRLDSIIARLSSGSKYDYLLNQKIVTTNQLQKALALSKTMKKSVEFILVEQFRVQKEELGKSISFFYGCPFKMYNPEFPTPVELINNLKKPFLLHEIWVPLSWDKNVIKVLIDDPRDLSRTDHIRTLLKTNKIEFSVAIKEDIEAFIKRFFDEQKKDGNAADENSPENFELMTEISFEEDEDIEEQEDELEEVSGQVVRLVDQILIAAYRKNASDIHIEPSPLTKTTGIRFRIDGVCQDYLKIPNSMSRGILSRIKVMAKLDIAERRLPQDGKIKFKRKGIPPFELRVATLPTAGGFEDTVLRILASAGAMKLDELNLNERNLSVLKNIIKKPYGLVLVVGPTGSGKTTTLHSVLGHINTPEIKIWTAEDPVEITQNGLRQVEAKASIGLDFPRIMRAFLRADPDVIMIGEMRDQETASIGVEASLTGHLVFSTLHTNSAPETVTRLLDMGLNPLNFSDAFLGVLAQRLVRRLCKKCRKAYNPSKEEFEEILDYYGREYFETTGIEYSSDLTLYKPAGCDACSGTGYKGRLGVHELMEGTAEIKKMIKKQANTEIIFKQAMKESMSTLKQDGILKVFQGITDISEIRRVCIN
ncbi:MAG: Flp pilus assembly complex ATPase component TadA [Deltaproteobacteria bacterium]|nr:Flp pilus assembly complex ATPase component TadA [Deltaproteobacteria bacterium]